MTLWLPSSLAEQISAHARDAAPMEACGILVGLPGAVTEVIPASNLASNPQTAFLIDPATLARTLTSLERRHQTLIGFYHSHPDGHPIPSERDIRDAHYPEAVMLIVGLRSNEPELAAWQFRSGQVQRLALLIQETRPSELDHSQARNLTVTVAVTIAGILAMLIVLIAAFSLLPAPELVR